MGSRSWPFWAALTTACALFFTNAGNAQITAPHCGEPSTLADDGIPLASALRNTASERSEDAEAESTARDALRADPSNPAVMFQLARALAQANKQREAVKYYLDAADHRHAGAMNDLGGVFEYGLGLPKNLPTAIEWYERAAGLGHVGAMTHLGELSENATGVAQDLGNARRWYEKAAVLGHAVAMNSLANLLKQAGELAAAVKWYRNAAERGCASAMTSLAELREAGIGLPQDYRAAREWYARAAELGDADAMGRLGALFESGLGGAQNLETAKELYVRGAVLGGRVAMHHLGAMLEAGRATAKNLSQAKFWYEQAAALADPPALNDLGRLYRDGVEFPKNYTRARSLFEQAAALGDANAMNNLGLLFLDGRGVLRDIKVARTWFEKAVALKNGEARANLDRLDRAGLTDGTQIAARRASCMRSCAGLQQSYVNLVCEPSSSAGTEEKPQRTQCVGDSLTLAKQCRDSCREWASTLSPHNTCLSCFQSAIACGVAAETSRGTASERAYKVSSEGCLGPHAQCMTSCGRETISSGLAH